MASAESARPALSLKPPLLPLRYDSARDSIAGVSGWIGNVVVGARMNHDRASVRIEDRTVTGLERNRVIQNLENSAAVFADIHVRHITCMSPLRTLQAMLFLGGIEVSAGGRESRPLTLSHCMNMNRVESRRERLHLELDQDSGRLIAKIGRSDDFTILVLEFRRSPRWFGAARQISKPHQSCEHNQQDPVGHRASI